jgi:hypothetical protein
MISITPHIVKLRFTLFACQNSGTNVEQNKDGERHGRYVGKVASIDAEGEITFTHRGPHLISADHTGASDALKGPGLAAEWSIISSPMRVNAASRSFRHAQNNRPALIPVRGKLGVTSPFVYRGFG